MDCWFTYFVLTLVAKGRTIGKLMGAGEEQKKIFAQGKIKFKKIHARQLILTNIYAMAKKNSYK